MGILFHDPDPSSWADTAEQHRQARLAALRPEDDDPRLGLCDKELAFLQQARGPIKSGANTAPLGSRHSPATEFLSSLGDLAGWGKLVTPILHAPQGRLTQSCDDSSVHHYVTSEDATSGEVLQKGTSLPRRYSQAELLAAAGRQILPKGLPFSQPLTEKDRRRLFSRGHKSSSPQVACHDLPPKPGQPSNKLLKMRRRKRSKAQRRAEQKTKEVAIAEFEANHYGKERLANAQQRIRGAAQREFPLEHPKALPARQSSDPPPPYSSNKLCFNTPPDPMLSLHATPLSNPMAPILQPLLPTNHGLPAFNALHQSGQTGSVFTTTSPDICHTCHVDIAEIERTTCFQFPTLCPICHHPRALMSLALERQQPTSIIDPHSSESPQPTSVSETKHHQRDLGSQNEEANKSLTPTHSVVNRGQENDMKALRRSTRVLSQIRKDKASRRFGEENTIGKSQQEVKEEGEIDEENEAGIKMEPQDELDVQTVSPLHP